MRFAHQLLGILVFLPFLAYMGCGTSSNPVCTDGECRETCIEEGHDTGECSGTLCVCSDVSDGDADVDVDADSDTDADADSSPCDDVECSGHGICEVGAGGAFCICDAGYRAVGLACLPDGPDGDADSDADFDDDVFDDGDIEPECIEEGGEGPTGPGLPTCCDGLESVSCAEVGPDGSCGAPTGVICCTYCGDGVCGLGENVCNCSDDCSDGPECLDEGERGRDSDPSARCCDDLDEVVCGEPFGGGGCSGEVDCFVCVHCGDGECGTGENICNCEADCRDEPECIPEGLRGSGWVFVPCCDDLGSISCSEPVEDGMCLTMSDCYVCADCGDGVCGPGENVCNCDRDCTGEPECIEEGETGSGWVPTPCCEGLDSIDCSEPAGDGMCMTMSDCFQCTICGDDRCRDPENRCNCPRDCA